MADFGLSNRMKKVSEQQIKFDTALYTDPKGFTTQQYSLNEKNDVYGIGMILWEISSGQPPFELESYDGNSNLEILQDYRETIVPDTPIDYSNLFIGKYTYTFSTLICNIVFLNLFHICIYYRVLGWRTKQ
ncbi:unnamed protein product [Rhizophagus irregularis]|nr:unnamed protein product [Rhizophagus irregularis]